MTLIKSISGIRGTIGGTPGGALTPVDIVKFTYAYCDRLRARGPKPAGAKHKVVVGRDARISGRMVEDLVCGTLVSCGVDVIKAGLASTPTTEMAVILTGADGGIIITASHNPRHWNALKLLNERGEFLSASEGGEVLERADAGNFDFAPVDSLGTIAERDFTNAHIDTVLSLGAVDVKAVRKARLKVVVDAVNSVGGVIMPRLMRKLGVECVAINSVPDGNFAHNPEPLPENLTGLGKAVVKQRADLGIAVDPDVDRLALICEDGSPFGEEYTLVSVADYILSLAGKPCSTVSNLSSSRALRDITEAHGGTYFASAVGEVNVTAKMREIGAVIGGEGNGGVIYPELHYGRDAVVGAALFLTQLALKHVKATGLRDGYPAYHIAKKRLEVSDKDLIDKIMEKVKSTYASADLNETDGVKITFETERKWVHLRRSNTEPIIRIYAEAPTEAEVEDLAMEIIRIATE